jgi:hypothetical protein
MWLPGGERKRERLAATEQMALPDHFVERARPQRLGERRLRRRSRKEVVRRQGQ